MVKEIRYTSIKRVLDDLLDHPMMQDLTLEQVIRYTIRFIGIVGYSKLYQDKENVVEIHEFRGVLPCDLISIMQVKDLKTGICLRAMTDTFNRAFDKRKSTFAERLNAYGELSFKTQGTIIYTSFPEGAVKISYKAVPVDDDGFPMLADNENFLAALEAYIKKQVFTIKFDQQKISAQVLSNAQKDYSWLAGQLQSEMTIPSISEMEAISRYIQTMIPQVRHFDNGFKNLGDREYLRRH